MNQSRLTSFIEAFVNTIVGFTITLILLPLVNYSLGIKMTNYQTGMSTFLFTIISVARGYVIRRFFNNLEFIKKKLINLFL